MYETDLIVDPFPGSGTTAVAPKRLNGQLIALDHDADAIASTKGRLAQQAEACKI
jgi:DNA modification methylase